MCQFDGVTQGTYYDRFSGASYASLGCERYDSLDSNLGSWTYVWFRNYAAGWLTWPDAVASNSVVTPGATWDPNYFFHKEHILDSNHWVYCNGNSSGGI